LVKRMAARRARTLRLRLGDMRGALERGL